MTNTDNTPVPDYTSLVRLDGRNLIVVGAGQGMGRQCSHAFKQLGARVLCVDIDKVRADEVAEEVGGIAFTGDMTIGAEVERMIDTASRQFDGPISGFVDIVGIAVYTPTIDTPDELWDDQLRINLRHHFLLGKHVGKHYVEHGVKGTMVFIASINGLMASRLHAAYGAAKAGVVSLTKTLAYELGPYGIRANVITPGAVLTPRVGGRTSEDERAKTSRFIPLRRWADPAEIAAGVVYLTSDLSAYVSGHTHIIDGGVMAADHLGGVVADAEQ